MAFVKNDDLIQALAPNRAGHALDVRVLPLGAWCRDDLSDSHRRDPLGEEIVSLRRKLRDVGEGVPTRRTMYFATVAWLTSIPSFNSSPWMRAHPTVGWRCSSAGSGHELRDLLTAVRTLSASANRARSLDRCHWTTVAGFTNHEVQAPRPGPVKPKRSSAENWGRPGRWRCSTSSWWRSAMTSGSNSTRLRNRPASHERSAELKASMPVTLRPSRINR
jgi:hypothetical protein